MEICHWAEELRRCDLPRRNRLEPGTAMPMTKEATVDQWKDFSERYGHCLEHYLELVNIVEQDRRARTVVANQSHHAPFFAPALAALGRQLVSWGFRLRARYEQASH